MRSEHIETTLVLIKPDGLKRGLIGRIVSRFEDAGLKIVGLKMEHPSEEFAKKHYTEDISRRRGEKVRQMLVDFLSSSPVVVMAVEGVSAIEIVRKIVGSTEPREALPGTIRGDFQHISFAYCNDPEVEIVTKNLIHASADKKDAENEVGLWFTKKELFEYRTVHESEVLE
jgi:nucleoside-diphosphate kinase